MNKLLPSDGNTKLGRLLRKLECAERASNEMRRTRAYLDELEKARPLTIEQASSLYGSALLPIIDHALTIYCSAFNSSNPAKNGIGKFDSFDVFGDQDRRDWHIFLKEYRDKNIAHLTNHSHKTWYLTSKDDRRIGSTGIADPLPNRLQPGAESWVEFREHLEFTRIWFEKKVDELRSEIEMILSRLPEAWFDNLPNPTEHPLIAQSWAFRDDIFAQIAASRNDTADEK